MMTKWIVVFVVAALLTVDLAEAKPKKVNRAKKSKGEVFTYKGPFFSLPVRVGSQKTKLRVGIDGFYGASIIYGVGVNTHPNFDSSKSTTWKPANPGRDFSVSLGTAKGPSGSDDLQIGNFKLKQDMFGNPQSISSPLARKTELSGFLAMWGPQDATDDKTTMQLLVEQAADPKITFYAPA